MLRSPLRQGSPQRWWSEQGDQVGGYATDFRRDGFLFDSAVYQDLMSPEPEFHSYGMTIYTNVEPERAPAGHHVIHLITLANYRPWKEVLDRSEGAYQELKARWTERLLARVEELLPGLKAGIKVLEAATPVTMERYTLNHEGAIYGWAQTPEQSGLRRPGVKTMIPELYQAGA